MHSVPICVCLAPASPVCSLAPFPGPSQHSFLPLCSQGNDSNYSSVFCYSKIGSSWGILSPILFLTQQNLVRVPSGLTGWELAEGSDFPYRCLLHGGDVTNTLLCIYFSVPTAFPPYGRDCQVQNCGIPSNRFNVKSCCKTASRAG